MGGQRAVGELLPGRSLPPSPPPSPTWTWVEMDPMELQESDEELLPTKYTFKYQGGLPPISCWEPLHPPLPSPPPQPPPSKKPRRGAEARESEANEKIAALQKENTILRRGVGAAQGKQITQAQSLSIDLRKQKWFDSARLKAEVKLTAKERKRGEASERALAKAADDRAILQRRMEKVRERLLEQVAANQALREKMKAMVARSSAAELQAAMQEQIDAAAILRLELEDGLTALG